jgi:hypothetical protein
VDDAQKRFVAWEQPRSACERISLEHPLASMLRKDFDNTSSIRTRGNIPLEVTSTIIQHGVEFVGNELIGREDPESLGVSIPLHIDQ